MPTMMQTCRGCKKTKQLVSKTRLLCSQCEDAADEAQRVPTVNDGFLSLPPYSESSHSESSHSESSHSESSHSESSSSDATVESGGGDFGGGGASGDW